MNRWLSFLVVSLLVQSTGAFAQTTGSSITEAPKSSSNWTRRLYADYFTYYHGPSLNKLDSADSVDNHGKSSPYAVSGLDSEITTAYMVNLDDEIGVGPDIPFIAAPNNGGRFFIGDMGVKAFDKKTVATENFRIYTNLLVQAPTSTASQQRHMQVGIKTTPYVRYDIPDSRFRIGAWTEFKWYEGVSTGKLYKLWAAPYVNYRVTDRFFLNFLYETETHHDVGQRAWKFAEYQNDFQPGFVYRLTPTTVVNPYLQIFPNKNFSEANTALGLVFNAILL